MRTKPKILILGNRGFIGAALFDHLKNEDHSQVLGLNSSTLDLTCPDSPYEIGKVVDKETIIILVARTSKGSDPLKTLEQDLAISCNVSRFLENNPIKKLLYFSSISVYGEAATDLNISEETRMAPSSYYGISKSASESILRIATQKMGTPFVVLRPCMIYGPGNIEQPYGPDHLINSLIVRGRVELFGDGSELRDFLFVNDLVTITKKFIFEDCSGIYNLGTGNSNSLLNIVEALRTLTKEEFPVIKLKRKKPQINQGLNISKLTKFFPECTFTPLEQGLKQSYDSFQNMSAITSKISL